MARPCSARVLGARVEIASAADPSRRRDDRFAASPRGSTLSRAASSFRSSRSGALSWMKSASATHSSMVATKRRRSWMRPSPARPFERRPGVGDVRAQLLLGARRRVPRHHVEAMGERARHPAAADDARAERGECFHLHVLCSSGRVRRIPSARDDRADARRVRANRASCALPRASARAHRAAR